jgi:PAS domain S-box-containing protein
MQLITEFNVSDFFEMTPDLVCIAGKDGYFRKVNRAVIEKLGYAENELFEKPISSFIHPEDVENTALEREELLKGKNLVNFENRYLTKSGKTVWLAWTSIYFPNDEVVFAIAKDITGQKKMASEVEEKYIKFKSLAAHFKTSIEEDRKFLALELHEELAQLASVIKMDVDWVRVKAPDLPAAVKKKIDHAAVISDLLIRTIQRINFSISPVVLEEIGLNAALKWHCKEFSVLNGIPCEFQSNYDEASLSPEVQIDFFRICQEALTNIMFHAEASNAWIRIEEIADKICLSITDNGKGFTVDQPRNSSGLLSMRKRAASINGELIVESATGEGSKISVFVRKP